MLGSHNSFSSYKILNVDKYDAKSLRSNFVIKFFFLDILFKVYYKYLKYRLSMYTEEKKLLIKDCTRKLKIVQGN